MLKSSGYVSLICDVVCAVRRVLFEWGFELSLVCCFSLDFIVTRNVKLQGRVCPKVRCPPVTVRIQRDVCEGKVGFG